MAVELKVALEDWHLTVNYAQVHVQYIFKQPIHSSVVTNSQYIGLDTKNLVFRVSDQAIPEQAC